MSTAAVLMVKDEADIIGTVVQHLLLNVDEVAVADNGSTDGTREILRDLPVLLTDDPEVGYYQSRKMTAMAVSARERGHRWVVPCDADEVWYAPTGQRVADFLASQAPDATVCEAQLFHHHPTALDGEASDPVERIEWREVAAAALGKVAVRPRSDFVIHAGNHDARVRGHRVGGLVIRHFPWRSPEQYVRKIRNGEAAYAATNLPAETGAHWRQFDGFSDEDLAAWFHEFFHVANPRSDRSLIRDPAPVWRR